MQEAVSELHLGLESEEMFNQPGMPLTPPSAYQLPALQRGSSARRQARAGEGADGECNVVYTRRSCPAARATSAKIDG